MSSSDATPSPISRLASAFAKMLGSSGGADEADAPEGPAPEGVTPRGVVEALLFVGRPGDEALCAEEIAATMRDVTADEVDEAVGQLNELYHRDGAPYRIEPSPAGYRMRLDPEHTRLNRRAGRPARLSQAALETLSVVAYRQPISGAEIDAARARRSGPALAQLVRRQLVKREPSEADGPPIYRTTERFLSLFDLASPEQLPRVAELDD